MEREWWSLDPFHGTKLEWIEHLQSEIERVRHNSDSVTSTSTSSSLTPSSTVTSQAEISGDDRNCTLLGSPNPVPAGPRNNFSSVEEGSTGSGSNQGTRDEASQDTNPNERASPESDLFVPAASPPAPNTNVDFPDQTGAVCDPDNGLSGFGDEDYDLLGDVTDVAVPGSNIWIANGEGLRGIADDEEHIEHTKEYEDVNEDAIMRDSHEKNVEGIEGSKGAGNIAEETEDLSGDEEVEGNASNRSVREDAEELEDLEDDVDMEGNASNTDGKVGRPGSTEEDAEEFEDLGEGEDREGTGGNESSDVASFASTGEEAEQSEDLDEGDDSENTGDAQSTEDNGNNQNTGEKAGIDGQDEGVNSRQPWKEAANRILKQSSSFVKRRSQVGSSAVAENHRAIRALLNLEVQGPNAFSSVSLTESSGSRRIAMVTTYVGYIKQLASYIQWYKKLESFGKLVAVSWALVLEHVGLWQEVEFVFRESVRSKRWVKRVKLGVRHLHHIICDLSENGWGDTAPEIFLECACPLETYTKLSENKDSLNYLRENLRCEPAFSEPDGWIPYSVPCMINAMTDQSLSLKFICTALGYKYDPSLKEIARKIDNCFRESPTDDANCRDIPPPSEKSKPTAGLSDASPEDTWRAHPEAGCDLSWTEPSSDNMPSSALNREHFQVEFSEFFDEYNQFPLGT